MFHPIWEACQVSGTNSSASFVYKMGFYLGVQSSVISEGSSQEMHSSDINMIN